MSSPQQLFNTLTANQQHENSIDLADRFLKKSDYYSSQGVGNNNQINSGKSVLSNLKYHSPITSPTNKSAKKMY